MSLQNIQANTIFHLTSPNPHLLSHPLLTTVPLHNFPPNPISPSQPPRNLQHNFPQSLLTANIPPNLTCFLLISHLISLTPVPTLLPPLIGRQKGLCNVFCEKMLSWFNHYHGQQKLVFIYFTNILNKTKSAVDKLPSSWSMNIEHIIGNTTWQRKVGFSIKG